MTEPGPESGFPFLSFSFWFLGELNGALGALYSVNVELGQIRSAVCSILCYIPASILAIEKGVHPCLTH